MTDTLIETTKFKQFKRDTQVSIIDSKSPEELEKALAKALVRVVKQFPKERPRGIHEAIQRALEGTLGETVETVEEPGFVPIESDGTPLDRL